jgi:hypothetical protein
MFDYTGIFRHAQPRAGLPETELEHVSEMSFQGRRTLATVTP